MHVNFTENESAFDELAKHIKNKPREEAESVRTVYYIGTLVGVEYRELRHLRRPDASDLIMKELRDDPALEPLLATLRSVDGSTVASVDPLDDVLGVEQDSNELIALLRLMATKKPEQAVHLGDGERRTVKEIQNVISGKIRAAAKEASEESKDQKAVDAPINRLKYAIEYVEKAAAARLRARGRADWSEDAFQAKLAALKQSIAKLEGGA